MGHRLAFQEAIARLKPTLVIPALDDDRHAVVAGLLDQQFVGFRSDDREAVHLRLAIGRVPMPPRAGEGEYLIVLHGKHPWKLRLRVRTLVE